MHRFTKVAPSRDALLAEASEEMQALLRFCFSHINCGELIALHAPPGSGEDELGLLDLVERVMSQPEGAVLTDKKVLWKHRIDSVGDGRYDTRDRALSGELSPKSQQLREPKSW